MSDTSTPDTLFTHHGSPIISHHSPTAATVHAAAYYSKMAVRLMFLFTVMLRGLSVLPSLQRLNVKP